MIVLTGTGSDADTNAALEHYGYKVEDAPAEVETAPAAVEEAPTTPPATPPASPGESPSGSEVETVPVPTEAGKEATETQVAPPAEPKAGDAKFETRRKQLERQVARLHEDLDMEKGGRKALQDKLDAATAELARLRPAEPEKPVVEALVRPKRPTKADAEFEEDKLEQLLDAYDVALDEYHRKVAQKEASEALAEREKVRVKSEEDAARKTADQQFALRVNEETKAIPEYAGLLQELTEMQGAEKPLPMTGVLEAHIKLASEHPGQLLHYFLKDFVQGGGKEMARLANMNEILQAREINRIETRLEKEHAAQAETVVPSTPVAAEPPAVAAPPVVPPKPKLIPKIDDEPITTVGSRSAGPMQTLTKVASSGKAADYIAARNAGLNAI